MLFSVIYTFTFRIMAESVDGVGVHQDTSDVYYDRPCESCSEDGRNIEAASFCLTCDTFLCQKCLKVHSRLASTKNHPLLSGDDMPRNVDEKPVRYPECKEHEREQMDKYCFNHEVMVCDHCKQEKHLSCSVKGIEEVCQTFDIARIDRLADTVADLRDKAKTSEKYLQTDLDRMEESRKCMLSEVKELFSEATDFLLRLYKETQCNIENTFSDHKRDVTTRMNDISDNVSQLDNLSVDLNKIREGKINERSFVRLQELLANVNETKDKLTSADVLEHMDFTFNIDEELQTFLATCSALGGISCKTTETGIQSDDTQNQSSHKEDPKYSETESGIEKQGHGAHASKSNQNDASSDIEWNSSTLGSHSKVDVSDIQVTGRDQFNASTKEDKLACFITGIAIRENGDILVVDWNNNKVKLFAPDGKLISFLELSSLKLAYWPCEACFIDKNTAAVGVSGTKRIHILKFSKTSSIKLEDTIRLADTNIWSVAPYDLELVVTCGSKPNAIKVLKMSGEVHWTIEADKKGQGLFENISSISTLGKYSRKVIVADKVAANVSLLHVDRGEILNACSVKNMTPKSVTVDQRKGHVYVYYKETKTILVWSECLSTPKIICNDLKREPATIAFNHQSGELLVSYESCDTIDRIVLQTII